MVQARECGADRGFLVEGFEVLLPMESVLEVQREIPLERLRTYYAGLVSGLAEAGMGGRVLAEVLATKVEGECLQCGARMTGEEMGTAFATGSVNSASSPKQARWIQGYCIRSGCPSRFYRVHLRAVEGVDWEKVVGEGAKIQEREARIDEEERERARIVEGAVHRRRVLVGAAGVVGFVGLWVFRRWWVTGSLPGQPPKSRFIVNPDSLPRVPGETAP